MSAVSEMFNEQRTLLALLGAGLVVGVINYQGAFTVAAMELGSVLYALGLVILAIAATYTHSELGYFERLSVRSVVAFASAAAVFFGTFAMAIGVAQGGNAKQVSRGIFGAGVVGMLAVVATSSMSPFELVGQSRLVGVSLAGLLLAYGYYSAAQAEDCVETALKKGDVPTAADLEKCSSAERYGRLAISAGAIVAALAIGAYTNPIEY